MRKNNYCIPRIDYGKTRPSIAIPDQSLSIQEIVKRYVRGVPVDVIQRPPVWSDQEEYDLEKLGRMDFGEKHEYAQALSERAEEIKAELTELARSHALAKQEAEAKAKDLQAAQDRKRAKRQPLDSQAGVN